MGLSAPSEDTDCPNGYKNKAWIYAAYKRRTLDQKSQTGSERVEKDMPRKWKKEEKVTVAILVSDKTDF